ncbi:hypothetical protein [Yoonia sp. BS5-3]|uniref:Uncharacterized protein n=1 Tax=Yoonia phaeophyticola TaxID=3137369 RepID=A0ABZ2V265_9RHOB
MKRDRINASQRSAVTAKTLEDSPLADRVRQRDALIFDQFYGDEWSGTAKKPV